MKKKIIGAILSTVLTVTMATPAFAEIIWTQDELPAGYTTNEWENKNFFLNAGTAIKKDSYTYYLKDLHGNFIKNAEIAGGSKTDGNGIIVDAKGRVCSYGSEQNAIDYTISQPYESPSWHQDSEKSQNANGISNYWYGTGTGSLYLSHWSWLMVSPDGKKDGLKYAYCFNEYGYLYTNTITPDGYMVNELGQLMIDGKVKTIDPKTNPGNKWYGYADFPIGALGYDYDSCGRAAQLWGTPNPFF
ncbi:hypothetical protein [Clostridium sp. Marseille-P2415]|uniref:hypothetical protein n=1 Tax=Clostridium sp. Marseille-P2415 TaxID=1805471 RepID=UPI0009883E8A|nr:hypothetical protein [Clostridium sp. Marseille-P2415]